MKLLVENDVVVCSLENKNSEFLSACAGMFDGFLNGKLKLYDYSSAKDITSDGATEWNADLLNLLIVNAQKHGIEIAEEVKAYNAHVQTLAREIDARRSTLKEERERTEQWARLCANGCGKCQNLVYDIDLPICKPTGEILEEKNVQKYIGGVLHLFNLEPFPSENCPFNINKKQGANNERLSETCNCKI